MNQLSYKQTTALILSCDSRHVRSSFFDWLTDWLTDRLVGFLRLVVSLWNSLFDLSPLLRLFHDRSHSVRASFSSCFSNLSAQVFDSLSVSNEFIRWRLVICNAASHLSAFCSGLVRKKDAVSEYDGCSGERDCHKREGICLSHPWSFRPVPLPV